MAKKDWMVSAADIEKDDDQYKILNAVLDKSCIVSGCAGSGKSVLALLKAQRIQKEKGNNYQIIVFTKALCRYMNAGREELGLSQPFDYHYSWKEKGCPSSDYIIVDEIQDFDKDEIRQFVSSTNKNFFFFGDTAQSIFGGLKTPVPVDDIIRILPANVSPKFFSLYRNYRLPKPVAKVAQSVGVDLDPYDDSIYKSTVNTIPRFLEYDSLDKQVIAIKEIIEKRSFSDVAILLPDNDCVKSVHEKLNEIGLNHEVRYNDKSDWHNSIDTLDFSTPNPKLMTYHSAKGLQFEAVFLPLGELCSYNNTTLGIPQFSRYQGTRLYGRSFGVPLGRHVMSQSPDTKNSSQRKALYVAMTRTYNYLYVLYSGQLGTALRGIDNKLYQTTDEDIIEDI